MSGHLINTLRGEYDEDAEKFNATVESILSAVEDREMARSAKLDASMSSPASRLKVAETLGGPLSSHDLSKLSVLCNEVFGAIVTPSSETAPSSNFSNVDIDGLSQLCSMLEVHIEQAASIDLITDVHELLQRNKKQNANTSVGGRSALVEEWLEGLSNPRSSSVGPGVLRYLILRNGLEAATILLQIIMTPNIDRRIISEDSIEGVVSLLRHHLTRNVGPTLNNTGHLITVKEKKSPSKLTMSAKKRRRSSDGEGTTDQRLIKELKKVYKPIVTSVPQLLILMETMEKLVYKIQVEDSLVLTLSSTALSVFGIEPVLAYQNYIHLFHVASIGVLTAISRRFPQHRSVLIEDIFPVLLHAPIAKKSQCSFPIAFTPDSLMSPQRSKTKSTVKNSSARSTNRKRRRSSISSLEGEEEPSNVHAISVLILSLIQSCVVFPTYENEDIDSGKETENMNTDSGGSTNRQRRSGIASCQNLCDSFVAQLLQRCSRKGEDGGASEFRPILSSLVDDFLIMQLLPEHPAAEMVLATICRGLGNDIYKASSYGGGDSKRNQNSGSSTAEATYLSTAFEIIGRISGSIAELLANQRDSPLSISRHVEENVQLKQQGQKVHSCFCGRQSLVNTLMVSCDNCKGFYHSECVGQTKKNLQEEWVCDDCKLKEMATDVTREFSSLHSIRSRGKNGGIMTSKMEIHVFRQLVLTYLSNESDTPGVRFAREFLLAQWVKMLDGDETAKESNDASSTVLAQHFLDIWSSEVNALTSKLRSASPLSGDGYRRLMIALSTSKSDLVQSFPRQMGLLIQFMGDKRLVSIRKLAVKALSQVVDADSSLMSHPSLKNAVSERFADEAKSVREAVVGLVGSFVVSCPELANTYHTSFLPRLMDEGVSVKKRTVKIFRDILMTNPSYNGRAAACALMLQRAADPKEDDSVRDSIHELFMELWLENSDISSSFKKFATMDEVKTLSDETKVDGCVVVVTPNLESPAIAATPLHARRVESSIQIRCRVATEQMIEIVLAANSKNMLTALLRDLLSVFSGDKDRKASERKKRSQTTSNHVSHLVDALVDHLLTLEERRDGNASNFGKKLVATVRTLGAMAEVSSLEVVRYVDTLLPYLKADNNISMAEESEVVREVCDILRLVSSDMARGEVMHLARGSLTDDIEKITYKFGSSTLSSAVAALCEFGDHEAMKSDNPFRSKAMKLATTFHCYLSKNSSTLNVDFSKIKKSIKSNIQRALSVLGYLCKSHKLENEDTEWLNQAIEDNSSCMPREITWDTMVEVCYHVFTFYLKNSDAEIKSSALKAMTGIFISRPRVLLGMQKAGIIESIMSPDSDPKLQLQALYCWREILLAEEKRVESGAANKKMESDRNITNSKKISGDQDGDATLAGGVLTQHHKRLYAMTRDSNDQIRLACVDLLSNLLRQGLLNPFQTIPHLFGLQGDIEKPEIQALALKLLINEGEKRPDMLRQRICSGVKNAFIFQQKVYPAKEATAGIPKYDGESTYYESIFGSIFKASICNVKKQKQGFFTNLLGLFKVGGEGIPMNKRKGKTIVDLQLLSFTAEVLAYLPYNSSYDPLFIIYHIQSAAALEGAQHLDKMTSFLQQEGFTDDINDDISQEDYLEIAAKAARPCRTKESAVLNSRKFDLLQFQELCEIASSFSLLLRLKCYLQKVYNLSETRCLEYTPDGQERNFDKFSSTILKMPHFDSKNVGVFKHNANEKGSPRNTRDVDKNAAIRQYAEFRKWMRIEQTTGARLADSDGEGDT